MSEWGSISLLQSPLVSTPGADARLLTDTSWTETDRGVPIYWLNGARVADDYADFYDGVWADEANPTNGLGNPHSLAGNAPWTGTDHDGTELFNGTASRAVGQASVSVGGLGSTLNGAGPLNGGVIFASTEERPIYGLWHVLVVDENLRLVSNRNQVSGESSGIDERAAVRAQLFTTGPNSTGYGISSIEVVTGADTNIFLGTVALYTTDTDGDPDLADGLHATLSLERVINNYLWRLVAPEGTVLKPTTTYALVFLGDSGTYPEPWTIGADGENVPADGWSLADALLYRSGTSWVENPDGRSLQMEIVGPQLETEGPALVSATVGAAGNAVTLVFDENVVLPSDEAEALTFLASLASAFAVTAGSAGVPVSGLAASSADPDQLTIGLSGVIVQGQAVTLTYTDPTAGDDAVALQDALGNETPTFTTGLNDVPAVINNSAITVPGAPTGLTATASGATAINLSWSAPASTGGSAITGYKIEVSPNGTSGWTDLVANTNGTATAYAHTGLTAGDTRHYRVSAINTNGTGDPSNVASATTVVPAATEVPADWSLKPTGLSTGTQFRLLFLSSTKRNASSTDIADYNTFIQGRAAAGHTDIQDYSAGFRVVGCTAAVDARDNTSTTYTATDKGVPIYWLNGAKAADEYEDFYDGSWDDEANDKNESGTNGPDTSQSGNRPFTGCGHNGTEALDGSISQGFGAAGGTKVGRPNSSSALHGPLSSNAVTGTANTRPMYGLSAVFQVAAAVVVPNNPPAFSADTAARSVAENTAAGQNVGAALTATDADSDTLTYTLEGTDAASFDIVSGSGQIRTRTGVTYNHEAKSTHTVIVKADDGNGGTDTVTVTIAVTDVDEPPGQPAAPTVSATAESTTSLDVTWTAPTNTGPAIASYDVQYRAGTSGNFTDGPQNVTGTSAAIGSLAADTSYEVQVRATNAEGDGDWSVAGTGRTTDASVPGAPTGLTATASGATAINLSWSAPGSTGGAAITGYKIEVSANGTSGWTDLVANTSNTTTYAHTGLAAGDTRHYRVSAINTNGAGDPSNVANATTGQTTVTFGASSYTAAERPGQHRRRRHHRLTRSRSRPTAPRRTDLTSPLPSNRHAYAHTGLTPATPATVRRLRHQLQRRRRPSNVANATHRARRGATGLTATVTRVDRRCNLIVDFPARRRRHRQRATRARSASAFLC